jgi:hypothetical protein
VGIADSFVRSELIEGASEAAPHDENGVEAERRRDLRIVHIDNTSNACVASAFDDDKVVRLRDACVCFLDLEELRSGVDLTVQVTSRHAAINHNWAKIIPARLQPKALLKYNHILVHLRGRFVWILHHTPLVAARNPKGEQSEARRATLDEKKCERDSYVNPRRATPTSLLIG